MSRIGKKAIEIPEGVKVSFANHEIKVSGPKGELVKKLPSCVEVKIESGQIILKVELKELSNLWGLSRTLVYNMVEGITNGFKKELEIVGVGYKAAKEGEKLVLNLGFSHPVEIEAPKNIEFQVEKNKIIISGIDKDSVGRMAAYIRSLRKPEPYKGKGIKYTGEVIRRKAGKVVKAVGAGPGGAGAK